MNKLAQAQVKRFGVVVREIREAHKLSQEALAEKADLNRCYLGEVERGCAVPSLYTIFKLADALNISPADLLAKTATLPSVVN